MANGYYLTVDIAQSELGVLEKIKTHLRIFSEKVPTERLVFPDNMFARKYLFKLPFGGTGTRYCDVLTQMNDPQFIYIRNQFIERGLIHFLKKTKQIFPRCKILLEIPTYPYDKDVYSRWYTYFSLQTDRHYRKQLKNYVDAIVTYSKDKEIFGCKTICVSNGVDCDSTEPITNYEFIPSTIRLIGVAQLRKHHGYERLLKGLHTYYEKPREIKVTFDILGEGPEEEYYRELIQQLDLSEYVTIHGAVSPKELIKYYNKSDIAISSLGLYKLGINFISTLKNRDYMARGLPIVSGCQDDAFEGNPYILMVSNDEQAVSVDAIVDFYHQAYRNGKECVIQEVRKLAYENADIRKTYQEVFEYL